MDDSLKETGCCPRFDPAPWDGKILNWEKKKFIRDKVFTFFFMPVNFGGVMKRMMQKVEASNAKTSGNICLSDHVSKWRMDIYMAVDKDILDAENVELSGKFISKVYEGDFKDTGKWCKDFEEFVKAKGLSYKKMYMWYTTCPKCAKVYGENYSVIIAELA